MDPITVLLRGGVALVVLGALYATAVVMGMRRFGNHRSWVVWGITVAVLMSWALWVTRGFPEDASVIMRIYFFGMFLALPLALTTWALGRADRRKPDRTVLRQVGYGFVVFLVTIPLGFVLGALPDALRLFR